MLYTENPKALDKIPDSQTRDYADALANVTSLTDPVFYSELPNEAYHALPGVSSSFLKTLYKHSPAHALSGFMATGAKKSAALDLGSMIHSALLEPDKCMETYVSNAFLYEIGSAATKAHKQAKVEWVAANPDKILMGEKDYAAINGIVNAYIKHEASSIYKSNSIIEGSYFYDRDDVLLKVRPDIYDADNGSVFDVKSTIDAGAKEFDRAAFWKYGYYFSAVFYQDAIEGIQVFQPNPHQLNVAAQQVSESYEILKTCLQNDNFHGYPQGITEL